MTEWQTEAHATAYLAHADRIPHRAAGEAVLVEELPAVVHRVLDLGAGDGRLMDVVCRARPEARGVLTDFSPTMLTRLRERFDGRSGFEVVAHDLSQPLPCLGTFDLVVSAFAIHHVEHARKRALYAEVFGILETGGLFSNLEHVASVSPAAHARFLAAMGLTPADEDPSNKLLDVETQLDWLRAIGFAEVDCVWRWRELALLVGRKSEP